MSKGDNNKKSWETRKKKYGNSGVINPELKRKKQSEAIKKEIIKFEENIYYV